MTTDTLLPYCQNGPQLVSNSRTMQAGDKSLVTTWTLFTAHSFTSPQHKQRLPLALNGALFHVTTT